MMKKKGMAWLAGSVGGLVILVLLIGGGCRAGTGSQDYGGALQVRAAEITEEKLSLKTGDGLTLSAMLARPVGGGPFPAVMINHGSGGMSEEWRIWTRKLAEKGYVGLAMTFRGFPGSDGTETYGKKEVEDILLALAYLKGLPFVDKERLGMFGFSKGGFNALLASTRTRELKAVVVWGAWADMVAGYRYALTQWNSPSRYMRESSARHVKIIGGKPEAVPEEWRIRSAINYVDNVTAAILPSWRQRLLCSGGIGGPLRRSPAAQGEECGNEGISGPGTRPIRVCPAAAGAGGLQTNVAGRMGQDELLLRQGSQGRTIIARAIGGRRVFRGPFVQQLSSLIGVG